MIARVVERLNGTAKPAVKAAVASIEAPAPKRTPSAERHPVYGTLLHDFGYKRAWLCDAAVIANREALPFWERNRAHRPERSKKIARDLERSARGGAIGFPGVISAFELAEESSSNTWTRGIVDGQHRCGALEVLLAQSKVAPDSKVLLEVHVCADPTSIDELFTSINKAEPVQALDLPRSAASEEDKAIVTGAAEALAELHRDMFKPSQRCRSPHLNVDNVRNALFEAGVLRRHPEITSVEALTAWALERNAELGKRQRKTWEAREARGRAVGATSAFDTALSKAQTNSFYLGLTNEWLEL